MDASGHDLSTSTPPTLAPSGGRLDAALERHSAAPLREGNRLALLLNGPDTYDDWLAAIGGAERWVHLDNYIFRNDAVGRHFADALKEKAAEGVPVRVLRDWFGSMDVPRSSGGSCAARASRSARSTRPPWARRSGRCAATTASWSRWTASTPRRAGCA